MPETYKEHGPQDSDGGERPTPVGKEFLDIIEAYRVGTGSTEVPIEVINKAWGQAYDNLGQSEDDHDSKPSN